MNNSVRRLMKRPRPSLAQDVKHGLSLFKGENDNIAYHTGRKIKRTTKTIGRKCYALE